MSTKQRFNPPSRFNYRLVNDLTYFEDEDELMVQKIPVNRKSSSAKRIKQAKGEYNES